MGDNDKNSANTTPRSEITSTFATTDDGTIQITFTIPYPVVKKEQDKAIEEEAKNITVDGFRKGMAPIDKAKEKISTEKLVEKTLQSILPKSLYELVKKENLALAVYPRFELVSAKEGEDWQVRATTCEVPNIKLGNYKEAIMTESKTKAIWTPDKNMSEKEKELSHEQKENLVLEVILKSVEGKIPPILIDEDVNTKLSRLLNRIEKLGLNLDSYLANIGKTPDSLREEYKKQSEESIKIELALNKIAEEQNIKDEDLDVAKAIEAVSSDPKMADEFKKPEQRKYLVAILRRQKAMESLISLI